MNMATMYKAVEGSAPGSLRVVERAISEPGPGQVRIRVEACGICHTDAATVTGIYPGLNLPRVPGHEVVGRIDALGAEYPDGQSGNGSVSASSAAKTGCASHGDAETW
jgi:D-arabinose 1-dehydrogenase-like Zn-dependent alcohol dehydrogenase